MTDERPLQIPGAALATYHGYKRSGSPFWAAVWGALGYEMPLIVIGVALFQGFAQPKGPTS